LFVPITYGPNGWPAAAQAPLAASLTTPYPSIILTGQGDISTAVSAMARRCLYSSKRPFHQEELVELLATLEKRQLRLENRSPEAPVKQLAKLRPARILGGSAHYA